MQRPSRVRLLLAVVAIGIVGVVLTLVLIISARDDQKLSREPVTILAVLPWDDAFVQETMQGELRLFEEIYPWVSVELSFRPLGEINRSWEEGWSDAQKIPAISVHSITLQTDSVLNSGLTHSWTGVLWSLYVNSQALEELGVWPEGVPPEYRTGDVTLSEFENLLENIHGAGLTPISVGAQFTWPLAAWMQHLALQLASGAVDESPQGPVLVRQGSATQVGRRAFDLWRDWMERNWVVTDWRTQDWPSSAQDLARGQAAMALLASSLSSSIPPEARDRVEALPYPHGPNRNWRVGSLWNIAVPAETAHPEAAKLLYDFLVSEGVTQRLRERLRRPFYPASGREEGSIQVFASVTNDTASPLMTYIRRQFLQ